MSERSEMSERAERAESAESFWSFTHVMNWPSSYCTVTFFARSSQLQMVPVYHICNSPRTDIQHGKPHALLRRNSDYGSGDL